MKIISDYTNILSSKKTEGVRICLISDIHHSSKSEKSFYDRIALSIEKNNPDIIIIAGDLLDEGIALEQENTRQIIEEFIFSLTKISKVILTLGNHDQRLYKNKRIPFEKTWYKSLERFNDLTFLDEKNYIYKNIEFITYLGDYNLKRRAFIKDSDYKIRNFSYNKNAEYRVLICHSPIEVLKKKHKNAFLNIDLILSGHMHNGALPIFLERTVFKKTRAGLVFPNETIFRLPFPRYVRGLKTLGDTKIFISKGIRKIPERIIFNKFFSKFFNIDIHYLNLNK